jgi:hypothetical protein
MLLLRGAGVPESASAGEAATVVIDDVAWKKIVSVLPADWEAIAEHAGLGVEGTRPHNASTVNAGLKVRTLLTLVASNSTLRFISMFFAGVGLHNISHVGIHGWMKKSVRTFQRLLAAMVGSTKLFAPELWGGYLVRAIDATTAQSPGAKGTTARIHYALRLNDLRCDYVLVTDSRIGESLRHFQSSPGMLEIADRGYSNAPSVAAIVDSGGQVLIRWSFASLPLFTARAEERVDPRRATRGLLPGQRRELCVYVRHPNGSQIRGRLLLERLPNPQAEKSRQRVRSENGGADALEMAPFIMLFTTVPRERLSADMLRRLYRLRWQVELEFKREKSIDGLERLPNFRDDTVTAWILAKLLLAQVGRRLMNQAPPIKAEADSVKQPVSISTPWEATTAAWALLRTGLLALRFEDLELFLHRFSRQLERLKMAGKKARRQIADFLKELQGSSIAGAG